MIKKKRNAAGKNPTAFLIKKLFWWNSKFFMIFTAGKPTNSFVG